MGSYELNKLNFDKKKSEGQVGFKTSREMILSRNSKFNPTKTNTTFGYTKKNLFETVTDRVDEKPKCKRCASNYNLYLYPTFKKFNPDEVNSKAGPKEYHVDSHMTSFFVQNTRNSSMYGSKSKREFSFDLCPKINKKS